MQINKGEDMKIIFVSYLIPIQMNATSRTKEKYNEIRNSQYLIDTLNDGAERADEIAQNTMKRVRDHFGLGL